LSCCVEQLIRHDALAVVLPPVVVALLEALLDDEAGTTHSAWQVAAVVLQTTMQAVVVDVCAKRNA
jgi:hypothetical protein